MDASQRLDNSLFSLVFFINLIFIVKYVLGYFYWAVGRVVRQQSAKLSKGVKAYGGSSPPLPSKYSVSMEVLFCGLIIAGCVGVYAWAYKLGGEFEDETSD